jgi:hypothetical protein
MFLLDWYKEWLNIRAEVAQRKRDLSKDVRQEEKVCESCETLKQQLEISNYEKDRLLNRLLEKPDKEPDRTIAPEPQALKPRMVPWAVRKQMLEREDREKARSLRGAAQPDTKEAEETAAFEKELNDATAARESEAANTGGTKQSS